MIFDKQNLFSEDQAITGSAASTNVIDLGAIGNTVAGTPPVPHLKVGTRARIRAQATAAFDNATSVQVTVEVDDADSFGSPRTVLAGEDVLLADLVAGKVLLDVAIPAEVNERYVRLQYTVTGAAPTVGTVFAGITHDHQVN